MRVCPSRLIVELFASVTALGAGSLHTNRQAIWLRYKMHTNTNSYTHCASGLSSPHQTITKHTLKQTHNLTLCVHSLRCTQALEEEEVCDGLNERAEEEEEEDVMASSFFHIKGLQGRAALAQLLKHAPIHTQTHECYLVTHTYSQSGKCGSILSIGYVKRKYLE